MTPVKIESTVQIASKKLENRFTRSGVMSLLMNHWFWFCSSNHNWTWTDFRVFRCGLAVLSILNKVHKNDFLHTIKVHINCFPLKQRTTFLGSEIFLESPRKVASWTVFLDMINYSIAKNTGCCNTVAIHVCRERNGAFVPFWQHIAICAGAAPSFSSYFKGLSKPSEKRKKIKAFFRETLHPVEEKSNYEQHKWPPNMGQVGQVVCHPTLLGF